jgi:hypothetical protein
MAELLGADVTVSIGNVAFALREKKVGEFMKDPANVVDRGTLLCLAEWEGYFERDSQITMVRNSINFSSDEECHEILKRVRNLLADIPDCRTAVHSACPIQAG